MHRRITQIAAAWTFSLLLIGCRDSSTITEADLVPHGASLGYVDDVDVDAHVAGIVARLAQLKDADSQVKRLATGVHRRNLRYLIRLMESMLEERSGTTEMLEAIDIVQSRVLYEAETHAHERELLLNIVTGLYWAYPLDDVYHRLASVVENSHFPVKRRAITLMSLIHRHDRLNAEAKSHLVDLVRRLHIDPLTGPAIIEAGLDTEAWYFAFHIWHAAFKVGVIDGCECCAEVKRITMSEADWERLDGLGVMSVLDQLYEDCCSDSE